MGSSGTLVLTIIVLALASFRLARLVAVDSLTDPIRARWYRWAWRDATEDDPPDVGVDAEGRPAPVARGTVRIYVYELLTCPHCLGVWFSIGAWFAWYQTTPTGRDLIVIAAIAGAQSALTSFAGGAE